MSSLEVLEARVVPAGVHFTETVAEIDDYKFGPAGGSFGQSMASGDFNGDGFLDLLVGAPGKPDAGPVSSSPGDGSAYVFFGDGADFEMAGLGTLNGANGFRIYSHELAANIGFSVKAADINGDGVDDMIVGAPRADGLKGAIYVIFGKEAPFASSFDVGSLDGTNGFKIAGSSEVMTNIGSNLDTGDFNGDGYDDILSANFLIFGHGGAFAASRSIADLDGANGTVFPYPFGSDEGYYLPANAGDINGDGYDDIVVSTHKTVVLDTDTPLTSTFSTGGAVLYGKPTWTPQTDLLQRDGINGVAIVQPDPKLGGTTVTGAGDINNDGFDDLIVGYSSTVAQGTVRIVYGGADLGSSVDIGELDGTNGFSLIDPTRQLLGSSAAAVGDFNGDGIDDIVMRGLEAGSGSFAYVLYGSEAQRPGEIVLGDLIQEDGIKFFTTDYPGQTALVSSLQPFALGDLNNDGKDDFAIVDWDTVQGIPEWQTTVFLIKGKEIPHDPSVVTISTNGKSATFTDVDGDKVTITTNRGNLNDADFTFASEGQGWKLVKLDLGDQSWNTPGTDLRINAVAKGGDGLVDVGRIDATGVDLRTVSVDGNLASIFAGDADLTTTAIKMLKVKSMDAGSFETPVSSKIEGEILKLVVRDFVKGVDLKAAAIGSMDIGGVLSALKSSFVSETTIDSVKIRGDAANLLIQAEDVDHASSASGPKAIGKVHFGGDAVQTEITAGDYYTDNWTAHIDKVKVKGAWTSSSINGYVGTKSGSVA